MDWMKFEGQTHELGAPTGWDQARVQCDVLPVRQTSVEGYAAIESYWKPSPQELSMLLTGGAIKLTILSERMPPVIMQPWFPTPLGATAPERKLFGLTTPQEPKYTINVEGRVENRSTGEAIPDDEPIIILRAKDVHAAPTIRRYVDMVNEARGSKPSVHMDSCFGRYQSFVEFACEHPDRMKQPD